MAQVVGAGLGPPLVPPPPLGKANFFRKLFGRQHNNRSPGVTASEPPLSPESESDDAFTRPGVFRRVSRRVVPGLPRAQTLKRQRSEQRSHLAPVETSADERRAVSVDRRSLARSQLRSNPSFYSNPRTSAPSFIDTSQLDSLPLYEHSMAVPAIRDALVDEKWDHLLHGAVDAESLRPVPGTLSTADTASLATSHYDALIREELEHIWILNLSMHFRDRSRREKFFVTYREQEHLWRRVTVSIDYRGAPDNSLEMDLVHTRSQREKNAKIYEAVRESLPDIQFYDTVTNLKLETTGGRLHVHVVEDGNEIISFPRVETVQYLGCPRIRERDIVFDSHMSGFVYKVSVNGVPLIKKEIPSPDTVDEFLYEVNALRCLQFSNNIIRFHGVVVDDHDQHIKGLLISYAEQGALVDIIFDYCKETDLGLPWGTRERWARQIVQGLADVHESGFVQGDFTLSNIVVDDAGDAKIIDINRRGCPVGWEPPEATPLIESNQRISMYIGVKSDLFQLGMVLWALAMQEDEPETQGRPLLLGPEVDVPDWYRQITETCLSDDPRGRQQASTLLHMFPPGSGYQNESRRDTLNAQTGAGLLSPQPSFPGSFASGLPDIRTVEPPHDNSCLNKANTMLPPFGYASYYPPRGRSPPSPLPSNADANESLRDAFNRTGWAANRNIPPSYSDIDADQASLHDAPPPHDTPTPTSNLKGAGQQEVVGRSQPPHDDAAASASSNFPTSEQSDSETHQYVDSLHRVEPTTNPELGRGLNEVGHVAQCVSGVNIDHRDAFQLDAPDNHPKETLNSSRYNGTRGVSGPVLGLAGKRQPLPEAAASGQNHGRDDFIAPQQELGPVESSGQQQVPQKASGPVADSRRLYANTLGTTLSRDEVENSMTIESCGRSGNNYIWNVQHGQQELPCELLPTHKEFGTRESDTAATVSSGTTAPEKVIGRPGVPKLVSQPTAIYVGSELSKYTAGGAGDGKYTSTTEGKSSRVPLDMLDKQVMPEPLLGIGGVHGSSDGPWAGRAIDDSDFDTVALPEAEPTR